jgi:putative oxidoreductase
MRYAELAGRILFSIIFIKSSFGHFSQKTIDFAGHQGLPFASILVPLSGVIALIGGLMILCGYRTRIGAGMIVLFLVPVTLMFHNFWAVKDPMQAMMQQGNFLKNTSMLGGAFVISFFGAGPLSIDAILARKARNRSSEG